MPFTFRKRYKILSGLYLNINKKSLSLTTRVGPVGHTVSTSGRRTTSVNLPGPLGWRSTSTTGGRHRRRTEEQEERRARNEATREDLQNRINTRRANIRRMRGRDDES